MRHELVGKVTPDERHEACRSSQQRTISCYVESVLQQLLLQIMYVLASCRDDPYGLLNSVVVRFRTAIWSGLSEVHYLVIEVPLKHLVALHTAVGDHCGPGRYRGKRRKVGGWVHASLGRILALAFREFLQHVITYAAGLEDPTRDILLQCLADWTLCRMRRSMCVGLFMAEHVFTKLRAAGDCPKGAGLIRGGAAPGGLGDLVVADFIFAMTPSRDGDLDAIIESQLNVPDGGKKLLTYRAFVFDDEGRFRMTQSVDGGSEFSAPRLDPLPNPTPKDAAGADSSDSDADSAD